MIQNENNGAAFVWNIATVAIGYFALIQAVMLFTGQSFSPGLPFIFIKANHWAFPRWFSTSIGTIGALVIAGQVLNPFKARDVYGGAHFASEKEIRKKLELRAATGLILGMTVQSFLGYKWGEYLRVDQPLSVLVYAPPGTGKTSGIIIPSLLAERGSCLVMDPKGEICQFTRNAKAKTHKIIRFAPAEPSSAQWNPLSKAELPLTFEETQAYVGRIAESLIVGADDGKDQHWIESGRALFRFWCMFLIWRDGETSLATVVRESVGGIDGAQAALNEALTAYQAKLPVEIKTEGYKFSRMEGAQFDGVIGTLNTKTKLFSDKTVATNTNKSDFSFKELRQRPTALYFVVSINDMARMKPLISLFFEIATNTFLAAMPKEEVKDKKKIVLQKADETITLYLDEFVQMGKMPSVIKMPSTGRGFRVRAIFILQSFSQLESVYGKTEASALRNNCSYHVIFTQNEEKMAEDISKSIGHRTRTKKSVSTSHNVTLFNGGSESEEGIPLVRVQDIMSLPKGQVLVLVQGSFETPVKAEAALYYKDRTMTKLLEGAASSKIPEADGQLPRNPIPVPTLKWTQADSTKKISQEEVSSQVAPLPRQDALQAPSVDGPHSFASAHPRAVLVPSAGPYDADLSDCAVNFPATDANALPHVPLDAPGIPFEEAPHCQAEEVGSDFKEPIPDSSCLDKVENEYDLYT